MNDIQKGLAISIIIHALVFTAFLLSLTNKHMRPHAISLDFTVLNRHGDGDGRGALKGKTFAATGSSLKRGANTPRQNMNQVEARSSATEFAEDHSALSKSAPDAALGITSHSSGQADVYGKAGSAWGEGKNGAGIASLGISGPVAAGEGYGSEGGQMIRFGEGSADEKVFRYIREGIMKNVRYPEKARRKGLTGKILLSFTVSEGGFTRDVKVVSSSGFAELDRGAKEAVALTTFSQKIPNKLFVILPIEYRLE